MGSGRDSPRPIIWTASMVGSTSSKVETEEEGSEEYLVTKIKSMARILDPLRRPYAAAVNFLFGSKHGNAYLLPHAHSGRGTNKRVREGA